MKQIPDYLRPLFWDINIEQFNPFEFSEYTISRVLEFGDKKAVSWLKRNFSELEITSVIKTDRRLSPRSANFWATIFSIPLQEITVLQRYKRGSS